MKMLFDDFVKQVQSKKIKIDFGHLYDDMSDPLSYFLEVLNRQKKHIKHMDDYYSKKLEGDKTKDYSEMLELNKSILTHAALLKKEHFDLEDYLLYNGFDTLKFHSFVNGKENNVIYKDGIISFVDIEYVGLSKRVITPLVFDEDFTKVKNIKITSPSKKLVFANFYRSEVHDEEEEEEFKEAQYDFYSLNSMIGRRNLQQYLAEKHNVGVGQMSNMSISVYSNGKEIIITEGYLEDHYSDLKHDVEENFKSYKAKKALAEAKNDVLEYEKMISFLKNGKFKNKGKISCSVWRWECIDHARAKHILDADEKTLKKLEYDYMDFVTVPIKGKEVEFKHYFNDLEESGISKYVYSHFTVK